MVNFLSYFDNEKLFNSNKLNITSDKLSALFTTVIGKTSYIVISKYKTFFLSPVKKNLLKLLISVSAESQISSTLILMLEHSNTWPQKFFRLSKKVTQQLLMCGLVELYFTIWFLECFRLQEAQILILYRPYALESIYFQNNLKFLNNAKI